LGAAGGYGAYRRATATGPRGDAAAGFRNRFAFGFVLGEDLHRYVGGELRYTYQDGDAFLRAEGGRAKLEAHSHTVHYDLLFHFRPRGLRVRPYLAGGGGVRQFVGNGPENPAQPLQRYALLSPVDDVKPMVSIGAGMRVRLHRHAALRVDLRDYVSPFPTRVIAPAGGNRIRGVLQQFTALAGISYLF
jgi:hypothetical protein